MEDYRTLDNRDLIEVCKAQEHRIEALTRRIAELITEVQKLTRELEASHAAIKQAIEHL